MSGRSIVRVVVDFLAMQQVPRTERDAEHERREARFEHEQQQRIERRTENESVLNKTTENTEEPKPQSCVC
jgi:hypothetical protein